MLAWIAGNAVTVVVIAVLLTVVAAAVFVLIKDKKNKKGGCTGNCATCGMGCSYGKKDGK
ncbi:MAG: FeoB-associated Cys-rich membrane protein [Clostridia bacterium]|jgi:hypothetical protein|nr:FeoB-associated Cys-rich membrane protein [Clostridia bacterium]MBQ3870261.1 FeoB-associated Cys-rich membrane protein [Clostridia bacterium]